MPLYYISAEEYSKKMQAASMPNAIAFVAHRSRFHLPSKPLGFVEKLNSAFAVAKAHSLLLAAHVIFINLPYGESTGA
nr:hypothetical protein [Prevotella sp.]